MFLHNRLNGLELGSLVRTGVQPVEEGTVQFVVDHFGELVAGDRVHDVNLEQPAVHAHDVFEGEDLVLLARGRLELVFHHAQSEHCCFAHAFDLLGVFDFLDLLGDGQVQTGDVLAFGDIVHVVLDEFGREARVELLLSEQLVRTDANDRILLQTVPFESLLVVPTCVFGLVADQLVGRPDPEVVQPRHVDVVEDEGHLHVGVDVDQGFAHLDLHGGNRVVQLGACVAVGHFELVGQLGVGQDFHPLAHGQCFGVGPGADHQQIAALVFVVLEQIQILELILVCVEVARQQCNVSEVQELVDVECRQNNFFNVVEFVQECL